jgi:peptide/nickel transport system permease protein
MIAFTIRRLIIAFGVAVTVSAITFTMMRVSGDLAQSLAGAGASAADVEAVRVAYGLDLPIIAQYFKWLVGVLHGDLGRSYFFNEPVWSLIAGRIPITMSLGLSAMILAIVVGLPLGVAAGAMPNGWTDRIAMVVAVFGQAVPTFWLSLLLMLLFGVTLRWLPISGTGSAAHFVLPTLALAVSGMPSIIRLTRSGMVEAFQSDYIRTAYAKGLRSRTIVFKHALRNALVPVVSVAAVQLGFFLGGSIVVESVFALNGVGYLGWESISRTDFPVVQGIVLLLALTYVLLTFLADLMNALIDPRMRRKS